MLTNAAVKAARPRPRPYKIADELGLHLYVAPTGLRSWRWRCRYDRRELLLTFGSWPELSLDEARARRDQARALLDGGADPRSAPTGSVVTFEAAARAWHAHRLASWTKVHAGDVLASLERDAFAAIGAVALDDIAEPAVLKLLRLVESRGCIESARRLQQRIAEIYRFAKSEGWARTNPASDTAAALAAPRRVQRMPALVDIDGARALLDAAEVVDAAPVIRLASRFLALTAVRLAALRGARWGELEDVDLAGTFIGPRRPAWRVPAARMKLSIEKKGEAEHDHIVPLSAEAEAVLRAAHRIAGGGKLIFPGRASDRPIGEAAIGALYARAGFGGRHVPHGWRATFSTILNERYPDLGGAIDRALAHTPKGMSKVEAAYNRAQHLGTRRRLFQAWGSLLT